MLKITIYIDFKILSFFIMFFLVFSISFKSNQFIEPRNDEKTLESSSFLQDPAWLVTLGARRQKWWLWNIK